MRVSVLSVVLAAMRWVDKVWIVEKICPAVQSLAPLNNQYENRSMDHWHSIPTTT